MDGDPVAVAATRRGSARSSARPVAGAVGVAPEADRHRRHAAAVIDQLAQLARRAGRPARRQASTCAPSARQVISPAHRQQRRRRRRTPVHTSVPPLTERGQQRPRTASCTQRKPSGGSGAPVEPDRAAAGGRGRAGATPALRQAMQERRAEVPKYGRRRCSAGQPPERVEVGPARVAVEQRRRSAPTAEPGDEVVPHHPAGGGEPEEPVAGPQVVVQGERLEVLERGCRRGRARSPWAARWCRRSTSTYSGWSNGTGSNASGRRSAAQLGPGQGARASRRRRRGRGARTVCAQRRQRGADLRRPRRAGRSPCRRSGSRRRRAAPSARSAAKRSTTLRPPNSGAHDDQTAPRLGGGEEGDQRLGDVRAEYATTRSPARRRGAAGPLGPGRPGRAAPASGQLDVGAALRDRGDRGAVVAPPAGRGAGAAGS